MAWNHHSFEKLPGWTFKKKSKVDRILEDLQVYRIATGQINSKDYAAIYEKHGWNTQKLQALTDNEKFGEIARILTEKPEKAVYYKSKSNKSRKRQHYQASDTVRRMESEKKRLFTVFRAKTRRNGKDSNISNDKSTVQQNEESNHLQYEFPDLYLSSNKIQSVSQVLPSQTLISTPILETTNIQNTLGLVLYGSDDDDSESINHIQEAQRISSNDQETIIALSENAPFAPILGPFCIICGRYGQYICNTTEEDVCSIECRNKAEKVKNRESTTVNDDESYLSHDNCELPIHGDVIKVTNSSQHIYIKNKRRYKEALTILDSHKCPLCGNTGHLPIDCRLASGKTLEVSQYARGDDNSTYIECRELSSEDRSELNRLYRKCTAIQHNSHINCCVCKCRSNLVYCVECNRCYCDKQHLLKHLQQNPSHSKLYSFKLRKILKCCNPHCVIMNAYDLYMCHKCGSTLYDKFYNMKTALWRREAIMQYPNLICCEEHMTWHVMNCDGVNGMTPIIDRKCIDNGYYAREGIINDMLFWFCLLL